tara:strand:+ start:36329 stop:36976 length:648 start_codon:yes stop_codon:yes gene_type:complete
MSNEMNTEVSASNRSSYHHGDLRQVLVDEAALMIKEEGEKSLSMRKLAARAGVSRTAPYHHFADKQALLCAIAEEGFRRFKLIDREESFDDDGFLSLNVQKAFVNNYVKFARENAQYYDLMFGGHLWESQKLTDSLTREAHASFRVYVERLRKWHQDGRILPSIDPLRYAQVSWSTLHGMSRLLIDGIYMDESAIEPICDNAAQMLWQQLTGKSV